ncbi:kelch-like protein 10 [Antennarius striatus]|uniref:kelch-like protein 10 n=1 Tax=Antennarius striatus TaxID=241820 RepID=UPI0035AE9846
MARLRRAVDPLRDVVICAGDVGFNVHRIIMCNCSPYFEALFCRHAGDRTHFTIPDVSADMMQVIVDFAYSGSVSVTEENIQDLLIATDYLIVTDIVEACNNFLLEHLTPENCIGVRRFTISGPQAQHKAHFLLMNRFEEVVSSQEFLELSLQELSDILDSDDLNVDEEKTVYEAAVRWINHEPEQRTSHLPALLSKARLAMSSTDDIKTLMSDPYLTNNSQCVQILDDVLRLKRQLSDATPPRRFLSDLAARPRLPNAIIFATGGWSTDDVTNITEVYDVRADRWLDITDHQEKPRCHHGTVYHDGFIYCIGGYDGRECCNSVRKFDVERHVWLEAAPMNQDRCFVSVACLDGYIYALGGLYCLRTAERYRPEKNKWSLIEPMHVGRHDGGCAVFNKKVGGYDGNNYLKSVEAYDPQTDEWHEIPPMSTTRSNFGTVVINNKLFVMGGINDSDDISSVEYYDVKTNTWTAAGQMRTAGNGLSCCEVSNHPSLKQYTTSRDTLPQLEEV